MPDLVNGRLPAPIFFKEVKVCSDGKVKVVMGSRSNVHIAAVGSSEGKGGKVVGHFHVIVDGGPVEKGKTIGNGENIKHYGKGQTEAELQLTPGQHTLTLQLGDDSHTSFGKAYSAETRVDVP